MLWGHTALVDNRAKVEVRMVFEVLGFATGIAAIGAAWSLLMRHERYRIIRSVYCGRPEKPRGGNALIWPSR